MSARPTGSGSVAPLAPVGARAAGSDVQLDHPSAYIPGDRRRALAAGETLPTLSHGSALFADISGFTPLTEALTNELGSQRASEVLTGHLNRVFHAVIAELDRFHGEVIYFSGDAITCWIDGDDGSRGAASGLAMQEAMAREGKVTTPGGRSFTLGLKVAVAVGAARRFLVGDPEIQLIDVLAGPLIDRLAATEQLAEQGEVLVDEATFAALGDNAERGERRSSQEAGTVGVLAGLRRPVAELPTFPDDTAALPAALTRQWLLPAVYERLSTGRGEFLAELRPAFPLFVSFGGIDYSGDDEASEKLDLFVRAAQRILTSYGGNLLQLTLGDKGAYLYGVFGTPHAHEDDAARICAAALDLRALERSTAAREIRIGITHGRLRSGTYGHARRRTFVCLGDAVNLAARLMSKAPGGEIYVSESVRVQAAERFGWDELEPLRLKGKEAPVSAFGLTPVTRRHSRRVIRYDFPIVGRSAEMGALAAALEQTAPGSGVVVGLSAEAGMGKSRLVAEFVRNARAAGVTVAFGECQAFGTSASYVVWREIWRTLLAIPDDASADAQVSALEQALVQIDPALVPRAPLLDALLDLPLPDSELTASFDPKLRKTSLESLLVDCLRALAREEPVVLVLEDCHWLDPLSRDLLEAVARAAAAAAILLLVVYRPEAALPSGLALARLPGLEELQLAALEQDELAEVLRAKLAARSVVAAPDASTALVELVVARAQGNPFYAEELLNFVASRGIDPGDERALASLELPGSLHSLILGRIDTLSEGPRRTLKVASVIGRVFRAPMLPGVYPELGTIAQVRGQLDTLRTLELVQVDRAEDESHLFKHAVTQEVVYESLPYALRAELHRHVGGYLEAQSADSAERNLDLLAYHYWHGDDDDKKRLHLGRAAKAAKASYANALAIDYYERLVPLLPAEERVEALLELAAVEELVGAWERARGTALRAAELATEAGDDRARARCETALAEVARKQGRFDEAAERLGRADDAFAACGDEQGLGRVAHLAGTLAAQRGDYAEAHGRYEQSLTIRRRLDDRAMTASVLSNLGVVAEYQSDYPLARSYHEQALALRSELGDRWAIAVSMTNLGMISLLQGRLADARERFEEAMRLNREVGDSWMVAVSENNLGNANRELGSYAAAASHYQASLIACRDYGDRWAAAFLLEDVGVLAARVGDPAAALTLLGAADAVRDEIGAPRAASGEEELAKVIGPAAAELGAKQQEAARLEGSALGFAGGIETALSLLTRVEEAPGAEV